MDFQLPLDRPGDLPTLATRLGTSLPSMTISPFSFLPVPPASRLGLINCSPGYINETSHRNENVPGRLRKEYVLEELLMFRAKFKSKCEWMRRKPGIASIEGISTTTPSSELLPAYPPNNAANSRFTSSLGSQWWKSRRSLACPFCALS